MAFPYKKVLVIGATSGIGEALASRFVDEGSYVIASGRRKASLEAFVHKHGKDHSSAVPFDITETDKIPNFVTNITKTHPDLDCILLNSGIQRTGDFTKPSSIDLDSIELEFKTNYLSYLALTKAFLPFLQSKQQSTTEKSALIYTSSSLALVPMLRCPNYCASKAALHAFVMVLREQLRSSSPSSIQVVEIFPPAVQTELHDAKHQPDIQNGGEIGMPLAEFIDEAYAGLAEGREEVVVGAGKGWYEAFEPRRREVFLGNIGRG